MFKIFAFLVVICVLETRSVPVPSIQWQSASASGLTQQDLDRARQIQESINYEPKPFDTSNWKPTEQNWLKPYVDVNDNFRVGVTGSLEPSFQVWGNYRF